MEISGELCVNCAKVDFFALFTGPRYCPGDSQGYSSIPLGTLADVTANTECPFCRLVHHDLCHESRGTLWPEKNGSIDPSKVGVDISPVRADSGEEMIYIDEKTRGMVATKLEPRLVPLEGLSVLERWMVMRQRAYGIQLLSPDSIDPARPLSNGYEATSTSNRLGLLKNWVETCVHSHTLEPKVGVHRQPYIYDAKNEIRVIDVYQRTVLNKNLGGIDYAALSYVWNGASRDKRIRDQDVPNLAAAWGSSSTLPVTIPRVVEDAIFVCKKLSIQYLWVDRYCIDQGDPIKKLSEIERMAFRYHNAKLTLIAGMGSASDTGPEAGLLPALGDIGGTQIVAEVQGRKYITSLPTTRGQISRCEWRRRAWTMQEGHFASRCAFFGKYEISFICGSGQWRESSHSGPYAHDAVISNINMKCEGVYMLSWLSWIENGSWKFGQYVSLLAQYASRMLSFESDKLNAIYGCLNFITEVKGVPFTYGLPVVDFHYALIWKGGYDRRRDGFPSWSWAGWHGQPIGHILYPEETGTCSLAEDEHGDLQTVGPLNRDVELYAQTLPSMGRPQSTIKFSQRFADISFSSYKTNSILTITAETARFSLEIPPSSPEPSGGSVSPQHLKKVPSDFDSTAPSKTTVLWDPSSEYQTPLDRLRLRDEHGNAYLYHFPPFSLGLPRTVRGETLTWLLSEGIDLIMILELEPLEEDESLEAVHMVFCLGIDRREDVAKRWGMFCLPKEVWERACPTLQTIMMG